MDRWLTWLPLLFGMVFGVDRWVVGLRPEALPDTGTEPSPPGPPK